MSRIRTIKPDFFLSEDIGSLTVNSRLLYIALWCQVDREGRAQFRRTALMAHCQPFEMKLFDRCWAELVAQGLVRMYEVDGRKLFDIPTFTSHQRPHKTEKQSTIPEFTRPLTVISPSLNGKEREREREREREYKSTLSGTGQTEREVEEAKRKTKREAAAKLKTDATEVLEFLNKTTDRNYQPVEPNLRLIAARIQEGAAVQDIKCVIAKKAREWNARDDKKMSEYLRPKTLFNATNFAQYFGEIGRPDA